MIGISESAKRNVIQELVVAGVALVTLVTAQLMLSSAIQGTNYYGGDGKMAQAIVLTTLHFGGIFDITNLNPLQGFGSQILPKNAWANPAFWPFAFFDRETATDISAAIALGCFTVACYVMARCFEVPIVVSAVISQLSIILFAPALLLVHTPTNFCLTPGDAVVYSPYMVSLGLLARLRPGSKRQFAAITTGITALMLYSIYCDPLWSMVAAICWTIPFATVTFCTFQLRQIAVRIASLACCLGILIAGGIAFYLFTLSQYTARVQFAKTLDRVRDMGLVSAMSYSPNMLHFHLAFVVGFLVGIPTARGNLRVLVAAAAFSWCFYIAYSVVYLLLLNAVWVPPIPIYMEQGLFVLWMAGGAAGAWSGLRAVGSITWEGSNTVLVRAFYSARLRSDTPSPFGSSKSGLSAYGGHVADIFRLPTMFAMVLSIGAVAFVPTKVAGFALGRSAAYSRMFYLPWPNQPEIDRFFESQIGLGVGGSFRGSVNFPTVDSFTTEAIAQLWSRGIPTANEYSQLITPTSLYFLHKLLQKDVRGHLNRFQFSWKDGIYSPAYWRALQLFGVRYTADRSPLDEAFNPGFKLATMPFRPDYRADDPVQPGLWYVYELPFPNTGNYTPTRIVVARSAEETMAVLSRPDFDFTKSAVLNSALEQQLVPASEMRLSVIRDGLHLSGHSDGVSLVILPQQYSNCLRPKDRSVRLVRADFLLTGLIFSSDIDTDISFDYGMFSARCRFADLNDLKSLNVHIDLVMPHLVGGRLFPDWSDAVERLRIAATKIRQ